MPRETITIAGRAFQVDSPYSEGQVINAAEADALNQTRHENIRNNLAEKLKKIDSDSDAQAAVDEYASTYEFGVRGGGGGGRDPVTTEAMNIARSVVRKKLQQKGHKISGEGAVSAKEISELAAKALAKHPEWTEQAKTIVAAKRQAATDVLDEEVGLPQAAE